LRFNYSATTHNIVSIEKLAVAELFSKSLSFCGTRRVNTVLTQARDSSLSSAPAVQYRLLTLYPETYFNVILPSIPESQSGIFMIGFLIRTLWIFLLLKVATFLKYEI
jgi:hypothetical protein